ncbi:MAG: amidohydrolase family protein, partial [Bacteroidales bacterium]
IADKYPSLIGYISPTHVGRTRQLFAQAIQFALKGGMIDISTGGTKYCEPYETVLEALEAGVSIEKMTFSSDGNAGVRRIDPETGIDTYKIAPLHLNLQQVIKLIQLGNVPVEDAFKLLTSNPARNMKLKGKGRISKGFDADLCFFQNDFTLDQVIARGKIFMQNGVVVRKGNFES